MHERIERVFHEESGRALAALIAFCRDFEMAEDALQDALALALERWPIDGVPSEPTAWLLTTAKRKIIDRVRRDQVYARKLDVLGYDGLHEGDWDDEAMDDASVPDERLKLIFTCCHPAIAIDAQVALTLRTLVGLSTEDIARAFLTPTPAMAQRLVRAQRKISTAGIPYEVPAPQRMGERMQAVLAVLYLIFNEGYDAARGEALIRYELCAEAIRLARVLLRLIDRDTGASAPALRAWRSEVLGLLALMLLHHSRSAARLSRHGELMLLEEQDRSLWNRAMIGDGLRTLDTAIALRQSGPYQLQAAISALHASAPEPGQTDWTQIAALYAELARRMPSPVIELNRAVAIAMSDGPNAGLAHLATARLPATLDEFHLYHAVHADFLRRTGDRASAAAAYSRALDLCGNAPERAFLERRLQEMMK